MSTVNFNIVKNLLIAFVLLTFASCSKENLSAPKTASIPTSSPISYTSENIAIAGFKAAEADNVITIDFTTTFQKNVKSLEILRGFTPNNLCSIYKTDGNVSSFASLKYVTDDKESASQVYYIVKYTLTNNDWGYTPLFTLATNNSGSF